MYKCENCEEIFDEPSEYTECVGEFWGAPAYQTFPVCPYCGDEEIERYYELDEEEEDEDE